MQLPDGSRQPTDDAAADWYEVTVAGALGPLLCSYFPDLVAEVSPSTTLLTGTCESIEAFGHLLMRLGEHGTSTTEIHAGPQLPLDRPRAAWAGERLGESSHPTEVP